MGQIERKVQAKLCHHTACKASSKFFSNSELSKISGMFIQKDKPVKKYKVVKRGNKLQIISNVEGRISKKQSLKKVSKETSVAGKQLRIRKLIKGVLSNNRRESYLQSRFQSPQPRDQNFIMLPVFDRGKRKISKMGGIGLMFGNNLMKQVMQNDKKTMSNMHSRRFTSTSPSNKFRLQAELQKKNTYNINKLLSLERGTDRVSHMLISIGLQYSK